MNNDEPKTYTGSYNTMPAELATLRAQLAAAVAALKSAQCRGDVYRSRALVLLKCVRVERTGAELYYTLQVNAVNRENAAVAARDTAIEDLVFARNGAAEADALRLRNLLRRAIETDWNEGGIDADDLMTEIRFALALPVPGEAVKDE